MSHFYAQRSVAEDRDLSRAAAERYLQLQAVSAERSPAGPRRLVRLFARLPRWVELLRTRAAVGTAKAP